MTATRQPRRGSPGVLTGSLFVLLWLAASVVQAMAGASFPRPTDDMATVGDAMRDGAAQLERSAGLQVLSAVALLWFAGILAAYLRRAGRPGPWPDVVQAGGIAATVTLMASAAATLGLGGTDLVNDDASAQLLYQLTFWLGGPIHVAALATLILGAARGLVLPKWLTIAGLVIGAAGVLAALAPIVPPLVLFTPIGRFLGFFWIVGVTVLIAFRGTPAATTEETVSPAASESSARV
ncbi:hypothetical protein [Actinophytocola xanthii]|uniref:DUF4386 domain-containing protein n=1 Tax=Actinophytocola xanthii TaxID=1912961 RepID=A0A1Q8CSQ1_9PSEU|nr:hypothetical protein [Actinophytocola xanthii]OLF17373.1 hypothetical protein BU204_12240 [Actinophytocola xanthii]